MAPFTVKWGILATGGIAESMCLPLYLDRDPEALGR